MKPAPTSLQSTAAKFKHLFKKNNQQAIQPLSQRQNLAVKCRGAARAVFIIYIVTVLAQTLPLQISQPVWYISAIDACLNNGVILLFGLLCATLASYWDPDAPNAQKAQKFLRSYPRAASYFFYALIFAQVLSGIIVSKQTISGYSLQLNQLNREFKIVDNEITTASLPKLAFIDQRLRAGQNQPPRLVDAENAPSIRASLLNTFTKQYVIRRDNLSEQRNRRVLRLTIGVLRNIIIALTLAVAISLFGRTRFAS